MFYFSFGRPIEKRRSPKTLRAWLNRLDTFSKRSEPHFAACNTERSAFAEAALLEDSLDKEAKAREASVAQARGGFFFCCCAVAKAKVGDLTPHQPRQNHWVGASAKGACICI